MTELNNILQDIGIKTIPDPDPITIVFPNGKTQNFQNVLDLFGISRQLFDLLSIEQINKFIDLTKESFLLSGMSSGLFESCFNYLIEVKKGMEAQNVK